MGHLIINGEKMEKENMRLSNNETKRSKGWKDWLIFIGLCATMSGIILFLTYNNQNKAEIENKIKEEKIERKSPPIMFKDNLKGGHTV